MAREFVVESEVAASRCSVTNGTTDTISLDVAQTGGCVAYFVVVLLGSVVCLLIIVAGVVGHSTAIGFVVCSLLDVILTYGCVVACAVGVGTVVLTGDFVVVDDNVIESPVDNMTAEVVSLYPATQKG